MSGWHLNNAARILAAGGVVAYPTEGVYGLGCDPQNAAAVLRLLSIKDRPVEKGLIVIASNRAQLAGYVCPDSEMEQRIARTWPGPTTWLLPAGPLARPWLTGRSALLAVRVSAHPVAAALCRAFGAPIVSTSANLSGKPPARSALAVRKALGSHGLDFLVPGKIGAQSGPTEIRHGRSGAVMRTGTARA
ncbi:MAG: Sua5/YciO/YrdC/YwlC family protein [Gammaproteobacteria bacterium]|nr:Sua5/YciO/YrdC/YwlC family protein [Gammaproteobacteria bacterium]